MTNTQQTAVTVLGLGDMGQALVRAFLQGGVSTTVWNRTPGKDSELVAAGAVSAATPGAAVAAGGLVIAVLFDHASVHETLDPIAADLAGRQLINLTSTAPEQSRELARWASEHGIELLDGGIMAIPPMIGGPGSSILYSGSQPVFDAHRETLELLGTAEYFGADAGKAALWDFSLLASMYLMFGGFFQGAALAGSAGITASEFAARAVPWVTAMAQGLPAYAAAIDSGDYSAQVQHLAFQKAGLDAIVQSGRDAKIGVDLIAAFAGLVDRQVAAGHGQAAFARVIEEFR
ncbi:NAD(P)-binding domain-containing protein [Nocardia sp. NPDC051030]|uniref:NAD(P)-dependent oxidoreductase n=1 Tax=Nocardia sp. NPDC051030 TaxID=3155162 RepID=UPI003426DB5A